MKYNILFIILILTSSCKGQESNQTEFTYANFEKRVINYEPKQYKNVSKKDYEKAKYYVEDEKFLLEFEEKVIHYEVFAEE